MAKKRIKKSKSKKQILKKEEKQEESELEKEIKEDSENVKEEIIEEEFTRFAPPKIEPFSPVLEKIEEPKQESLEENLSSSTTFNEKKEEKLTKYIEPNYEDIQGVETINENLIIQRHLPMNIEPAIRDLDFQREQNFQINPELEEVRRQNQRNLEKDYVVKVGGFKETKTHSPIEQQPKKYEIK